MKREGERQKEGGEWIRTGKLDVGKKRYLAEEETPRPNYEEFGFHLEGNE